MKEKETTKPPRSKNGDDREKRLGTALVGIRLRLIKPYLRTRKRRRKKRICRTTSRDT